MAIQGDFGTDGQQIGQNDELMEILYFYLKDQRDAISTNRLYRAWTITQNEPPMPQFA